MELLCVLAALAALFLLCVFLTRRTGLPAALAPLTALGLVVGWLTLAGMADLLLPGAVVLYLVCAGLGVWALVPAGKRRPDAPARPLFTPGSVLFWGLALAFAVYFFIRQPIASNYDELSLWATAVKVTKVDNRLYPLAELGTPWPTTQNPGLMLLSYFFSFFGSYADWKIYLAYDVLAFAVYAAVLGNLGWKQYRLAVPLAAILWCTPYFFTVYNHEIYLVEVYMSAYGDIPAGLVLGGAVALWLAVRRGGGPRWAVLPVLALAANIKDNTFVLALVAAGLVAVDAWLLPEGKFRRGLARRTGFAAACFAAPMAVYYLWNVRYRGMIVARNAARGGTGETSLPLSGVVVNGLRMLLGGDGAPEYEARREQFFTAIRDMGTQYFTPAGKMSMIGHGLIVTLFILAIFALAMVLAGRTRLCGRIGLTALLSLVCFGGYNLELALCYGFIFKPDQAAGLVDYNRYIYCYYIGWFLIALACLVVALQAAGERVRAGAFPLRPLAGQGIVLLLAAGMLLRQNQLVLPQLTVLGFSDSEFADRQLQIAEAGEVSQYLTEEDRVFFVSQGDDGMDWFAAVFDFYPIIVDYSGASENGGGGTFGLPELCPETGVENRYYHPYTVAAFARVVEESGCSYLYLQRIDDIFVQSYASLFTDSLQAAQNGKTVLYKVTEAGFAPVEMEVAP
mgnify:FL=1